MMVIAHVTGVKNLHLEPLAYLNGDFHKLVPAKTDND